MQRGSLVAGKRDEAEVGMVRAQPCRRGHAVEQWHVEIDDDSVGIQVLGELDCLEPVRRFADDRELGLAVDQVVQRFQVGAIVVGDQDPDPVECVLARILHRKCNASLAALLPQETTNPVAIIGAALDLGAGRRGVDMGPSAIRYAGLDARIERLGRSVEDWGNVMTAVAEASAIGNERLRFLPQIKETCERIADLVGRAVEADFLPLVLGGDHSVALGTLGGLARARGPGGVLWLDAHGDLNRPETSPSGNVHGMPLAAALGLAGPEFEDFGFPLPAVESARVALVGVRELDEGERELLGSLDARVYTMSDVDRLGVERIMRESLSHVAGAPFVHLSLDMDVLDPEVAPGVGTPVRGGLSYREAHLAMELVAEAGLVSSLEVVEVNPILDRENETSKLAVELVASALGARIL
jgi:arginase